MITARQDPWPTIDLPEPRNPMLGKTIKKIGPILIPVIGIIIWGIETWNAEEYRDLEKAEDAISLTRATTLSSTTVRVEDFSKFDPPAHIELVVPTPRNLIPIIR